jgi:hypothetical protein
MAKKRERPIKASTIDRLDKRRQANSQKQPWPLHQIQKFDKLLRNSLIVAGPPCQ